MKHFELPKAPPEQTGQVKEWFESVVIPTYLPLPPDKNPMFLDRETGLSGQQRAGVPIAVHRPHLDGCGSFGERVSACHGPEGVFPQIAAGRLRWLSHGNEVFSSETLTPGSSSVLDIGFL